MTKAKHVKKPAVAAALLGMLALGGSLPPTTAAAQTAPAPIKVGVVNDQSGPYADAFGRGSVIAAQMAVEDFGGQALGRRIEVLAADHQNKADIGVSIVRKWFENDGVDMAIDFGNSAVSLAVQNVAKTLDKVVIHTSGTGDITQKSCVPSGFSWAHNTHALSSSPARTLVKQGFESWYFLAVDYAFGDSIIKDASGAIVASGGTVVGSVRHPLNAGDFSSFLLQAQASKAKVVSIVNSGSDLANALKQAHEFGLVESGQRLVAPLVFITDVHSMGLAVTQGLSFVTAFYWDRTDATRAFGKRFLERRGTMPTMSHAAVYSGVLHYLKAVKAAGTSQTDRVVAKMRELPVQDIFTENGRLRPDGRLMHDLYLVQVKSPAESKGLWDYYKVLATVPAEEAFNPLSESQCPLVKG